MPINKNLFNERRTKVVNKTFDDFRNELLRYANTNFSDQIKDFSEASMVGLFLDFAASVGESMAFYLEQQFDELNYETSINTNNIQRHLRQAGIVSNSPTPSVANVTFFIEVLSKNNTMEPDELSVPVIQKETVLSTNNEISFILQEDINFMDNPEISVGDIDSDGLIQTLILTKDAICISGEISNESVSFEEDDNNLFISYNLSNPDVTSIISVIDQDLNYYYEVESLSQDTVYTSVENSNNNFFQLKYAAHRFIKEENLQSGITSIRFGNGKSQNLKDDILTNPEDITLPLKNRGYDSSYSLDPRKLLKTNTLGVSPQGKTLNIKYKHGGGLNHNVSEDSIVIIDRLIINFPKMTAFDSTTEDTRTLVTESVSVTNKEKSVGGSNRLTLTELVQHIPSYKKMQNRVINHEDLISRIYTMPSNFGRINKAVVLDNPYSNISKNLYIICKDINNHYTYASDQIKLNLKKYINNFRLIGDSYNIIDSPIYNFGVDIVIKVKSGFDSENVLNTVLFKILDNMRFDALQIGQAINVNEIIEICLSVDGVASIISDQKDIIVNKNSNNNFYSEEDEESIEYSNNKLSIYNHYENGLIFPKTGGIFELKYEDFDISIRNG